MDHEYAGIIGLPDFCKEAAKLAFGGDNPMLKEKLVMLYASKISLCY